jgi:hypothetical protein
LCRIDFHKYTEGVDTEDCGGLDGGKHETSATIAPSPDTYIIESLPVV